MERVLEAAELLGDLAREVVFTGGASVGLLITDPAVPAVRPTLDIDVIVEVASLAEYYRLQERLRAKGFSESMEDGVICRWRHGSIILDVMPTDERILGFANRWYAEAVRNAQEFARRQRKPATGSSHPGADAANRRIAHEKGGPAAPFPPLPAG